MNRFTLWIAFLLLPIVSFSQVEVEITSYPDTVCSSEQITVTAKTISGAPTSFTWRLLSTTGNKTIGNNKDQVTFWSPIVTSQSTITLLYIVSDGSSMHQDSCKIVVQANPIVKLYDDFSVCCNNGPVDLELNALPANGPKGGTWSVSSFPSWIKDSLFFSDSACAPNSHRVTVNYKYYDSNTACTSEDDISITVDPLPAVILQDGDFCQDINTFRLADELVNRPANVFNGTPSWKCLECNGNDFSKMLDDRGVGFADYWLKVDESSYQMYNSDKDTVTLEFTFRNPYGCINKDTVEIRIWRVPKLKFTDYRELCWDEGELDLNDLFGVNAFADGWWTVETDLGYRNPSDLGGITDGTNINTEDSKPLASASSWPKAFKAVYHHDATGCYANIDTTLIINPLPSITFLQDPSDLAWCEVAGKDLVLEAYPKGSGGMWSSSIPGLISRDTLKPSLIPSHLKNQDIWLKYEYTDPNTGCYSADSLSTIIAVKPEVTLPPDTTFCREAGQLHYTKKITINSSNVATLHWSLLRISPAFNAIANGTDSTPTLSFTPSNDTVNTYILTATPQVPSNAICKDVVRKDMYIRVHPIPDVRILPTEPGGCNPLETDFQMQFRNVDSSSLQYNWDFGSSDSSNRKNPKVLFTKDGTTNVSLKVTSSFGCDTSTTTRVEVYPLPNPDFSYKPSYITTANPSITLLNKSSVNNVFNTSITDWDWDFGSSKASPSTSTLQDPKVKYPADSGSYSITLACTTNHGCVDSVQQTITIVEDQGMSAHPNPAHDKILVTIPDSIDVEELLFIDYKGNIHMSVGQPDAWVELDVKGLNPGLYFAVIRTSEGLRSKKVIVY